MRSGAGTGFGIGAAFALVGFVYGILIGRTTTAMAELGAKFQGGPSPEQQAQMQVLRVKQAGYSRINVIVLLLSVTFMAIARYLVF